VRYWTSRGFAFVDVNYGGSTGFGRAYRELLQAAGVSSTWRTAWRRPSSADAGRVDPRRMAIRGSSSSGFTTLCALILSTHVFRAGASFFGVSDLAGLDADTHKFESRYTEWLVAPPPERERLYRERSPLLHASACTAR
jgi:dipeptidyl aminopeptidase/acylaminoacyl peptidase